MNIYSKAKEIYNDTTDLKRDIFAAKKIVSLLKFIALIIISMIFLLQYWNFFSNIPLKKLPIFPIVLRKILNYSIFIIIIVLIIYHFVGRALINLKNKTKLLPIYDTIDDILEISTMIILNLKLISNLISFVHGINIMTNIDKTIYYIYLTLCLYVFVIWLYENNKKFWYLAEIQYTPYFDSLGNRIAYKDKVIYHGILYYVYENKNNMLGSDNKWYLSKDYYGVIHKEISLEEAVKDDGGKIRVYKYGMGERWKNLIK